MAGITWVFVGCGFAARTVRKSVWCFIRWEVGCCVKFSMFLNQPIPFMFEFDGFSGGRNIPDRVVLCCVYIQETYVGVSGNIIGVCCG